MTDDWATPQDLFNKLNDEFNFVLDVCALPHNVKCAQYFTPEIDALTQDWSTIYIMPHSRHKSIWMNPPYGRGIEKWMQKAYETAQRGECVVCLIPGRTNAPWWHEWVMKARQVRFIVSKVPFIGPEKYGPFWGSVIVVFDGPQRQGPPTFTSYRQPRHEAKDKK
jgi:phage N-6-adenine-methyltransferase